MGRCIANNRVDAPSHLLVPGSGTVVPGSGTVVPGSGTVVPGSGTVVHGHAPVICPNYWLTGDLAGDGERGGVAIRARGGRGGRVADADGAHRLPAGRQVK